uniref:Putative ovule protein n=1 Tax=Solanum chacoense TaxID=4108 RepID=A0A0V0GXZ6_SOLCH
MLSALYTFPYTNLQIAKAILFICGGAFVGREDNFRKVICQTQLISLNTFRLSDIIWFNLSFFYSQTTRFFNWIRSTCSN